MPQIFHPSMNTFSRVTIFGAVFILAAVGYLAAVVVRSPYVTQAGVVQVQPVPFSHKHHVADDGLDCRYCHTSVETSSSAGMPSTKTCMGCHWQLFADSPMLAPVRESFRTGRPLRWTRVHDLPDYAYFDHSIHVHKGIGCASCHGRVDEMPLMWRSESLLMEWCVNCHRHPAQHVRPREFVFRMESLEQLARTHLFEDYLRNNQPQLDPQDPNLLFHLRATLVRQYGIREKTNCSYCHR